MTIHRIAAIALTATALSLGAGLAQAAGPGGFETRLEEAQSRAASAGRETHGTIATHLSAAEDLHAEGNEARAEQYLRFARGLLGLGTTAPSPDTRIGERADTRSAVN